ncbi:DUF928 domain-containing protein [Candidatus Venteria ishoeyi]|uniref:DUF928 domain-containing protein n=1 Tax=Candidatus Venteria ishoeyi TaxID=1899563 RepID=A0A1H6FDY7_9GAMM|nr:DUF928 domain-containing protein [Candidatus Venteria ishoeyi]SEH08300.1 Uncharacterised protein [Candidatus Venteria ishoeyi]
MKSSYIPFLQCYRLLCVVLCAGLSVMPAVQAELNSEPRTKPMQMPSFKISYVPPNVGAPTRRVGAGTRGKVCNEANMISESFKIVALGPVMTGYTLSAQPVLYWSINQAVQGDFIFTINPLSSDAEAFSLYEPLLDETRQLSLQAGIHAFKLSDYAIELKTKQEYEWSVTLVCDNKMPSLNLSATGSIQRIAPSQGLLAQIKSTSEQQQPYLYARSGIWYEALQSLSQLIENVPDSRQLKKIRHNLLQQEKLDLPIHY